MPISMRNRSAELFVPDGVDAEQALARTTHLGIAAHPDDLEVMALHGILACADSEESWFTGVVVTDGGGSPRTGRFADYTDDEMRDLRRKEQKSAAALGRYSAIVFLDYASSEVKQAGNDGPVDDLTTILAAASATTAYVHNLADRHDTHVAVALRALAAMRRLPMELRPRQVFGCEVWRSLDWLDGDAKLLLDVSGGEAMATQLLQLFQSQLAGGKRYDVAAVGRWRANATFLESHRVDRALALGLAMDLSPLVVDADLAIDDFVREKVDRLAEDIASRLERLSRRDD